MNDAPGGSQGSPPQEGWVPPRGPGWGPQAPSPGPGWGPQAPSPGPGWGPQAPPSLPPGVDWGFKDRKIAAGICGIMVGSLGVHKFILGYVKEGVIMALLTVGSSAAFFVSMFIPAIVGASSSDTAAGASVAAIFVVMGIAWLAIMAMYVIGLIEGILYLTKSDYDFVMRYRAHHRGWF